MNTLKKIILCGGNITEDDHAELKNDFPNLALCIKWGQAPREPTTLGKLEDAIKKGVARADYVREVFIPVPVWDKLCEAFGFTDEDQREYLKTL
jgi:hypothetical protein